MLKVCLRPAGGGERVHRLGPLTREAALHVHTDTIQIRRVKMTDATFLTVCSII